MIARVIVVVKIVLPVARHSKEPFIINPIPEKWRWMRLGFFCLSAIKRTNLLWHVIVVGKLWSWQAKQLLMTFSKSGQMILSGDKGSNMTWTFYSLDPNPSLPVEANFERDSQNIFQRSLKSGQVPLSGKQGNKAHYQPTMQKTDWSGAVNSDFSLY